MFIFIIGVGTGVFFTETMANRAVGPTLIIIIATGPPTFHELPTPLIVIICTPDRKGRFDDIGIYIYIYTVV